VIVVLDLDDTLYDEATYVDSGMRAVAAFLAPRLGDPVATLTEELRRVLEQDGRGAVFDSVLAAHGSDDPALVAACVDAYRTHVPVLSMRDDVRAMIAALAPYGPYLVTDGDPGVQQRKVDALGIAPLFAGTYLTWAYGPAAGKPSLHCFELIRAREDVAWTDLAYVADDPAKDFVALNEVGATTVRVHRGRHAQAEAAPGFDARLHVDDVTDAPAALGLTV
jgi:putative hydrolase of the HAD superfamily